MKSIFEKIKLVLEVICLFLIVEAYLDNLVMFYIVNILG